MKRALILIAILSMSAQASNYQQFGSNESYNEKMRKHFTIAERGIEEIPESVLFATDAHTSADAAMETLFISCSRTSAFGHQRFIRCNY